MSLKDLTDKLEGLDEDAFASLLELEYTHDDEPKRRKRWSSTLFASQMLTA